MSARRYGVQNMRILSIGLSPSRYWKNKYGFDSANAVNRICFFANGTGNKSCTEQTVYAGVSVEL